ncbi:Inositol 2-dehydrogenase/D-chiro-inositol 3-dehydrogenase [Rubripirellula tenax]|uniref:Inositol 2-dehydrogenase/D-chiro-inositol 3-dehydrogenase n=1 Tax=Rubripirellula tenax TaxID=2528015 RepID=A0A5C6EFM7_9BACT|nr:Gfo/Idh/MocA family oxidoreductase [Rubripirellula tenax]TWU47315.1 Inositol 2-dehydrogenase/D-chiro-inositol 3-dehydrogenase [Rubripirellula tenax]
MPKLNRRHFSSVAASALAVAATSRQTYAQNANDQNANDQAPNDQAPNDQAPGPNEQIEVCIVGVNSRGMEHVRGFNKDPRTTIRAIVDVDREVGQKRAEKILEVQGKKPEVFVDVREALESGTFDVLSCATPNHWHALCGIWAMQAGKDVYIEKPISHNIHEGRALVAASAKYGRIFQTGTQCRSSTACADAAKFIADGGIGECNFARGLCYKRRKSIGALGDYPVPSNVDFELWSGPAPYTDPKVTRKSFHYDWHWQRHYGNGDLGNQGPHQTDVARWGLGVNRHPESIISYGCRLGYDIERKDPDYVDAGDTANTEVSIYDYGDKCLVFETRGLDVTESAGPEVDAMFGKGGGNKIGVIFYGSEGYVAQVSYDRCIVFDKDMKPTKEFKARNVGDAHFANFIDAVQSRDAASINADALTGHLSAAVSHLGNISYYLGEDNHSSVDEIKKVVSGIKSLDNNIETLEQTIAHLESNGVDLNKTPLSLGPKLNFDPEKETFVDNTAADALLTRVYREGFEVPSADKV